MKIGLFIEPIFSQKAGIHQFTRQLFEALCRYGSHDYVQVGSQLHHENHLGIIIPNAQRSIANPLRWLNSTAHKSAIAKLDYCIDPSHFGTTGLIPAHKRIAVIHDLTPITHPETHAIRTRVGHQLFMRSWINNSAAVLTLSNQVRSDIHTHFGSDIQVSQLYPGTDIQKEPTELDLPFRRYVLAVGTLEPRKNLLGVISAFEKVEDETVHLVCVGPKGWKTNLDRIKSESTVSKRIHFLGFVSRAELSVLYQGALMLVYPSLYEGFGLPVLEAMSLGCPVITSNIGATKEVAANVAVLVDPNNDAEILAQMNLLLSEKSVRSDLIHKGLKRASSFSWKNFVEQFETDVLPSISR